MEEQEQQHREASEAYLAAWRSEHPYWMTEHHLDSYDQFVNGGIQRILTKMDLIQLTKSFEGANGVAVPVVITVVFGRRRGVSVAGPPIILPREAREQDLTYAIEVKVDVDIDIAVGSSGTKSVQFDDDISLGTIPLMLHSRNCVLRDQSGEALRRMGECPHDHGGYFVIDGAEKTLVAREDLVNNRLYVREADRSTPELSHIAYMRSATHDDTFPRTATFYVRTTETISIVVTHIDKTRTRGGGGGGTGGQGVPICVIFRALGIDSDLDILRHIVLDVDDPEEQDVVAFLRASLVDAAQRGVMDQASAHRFLAPMVKPSLTLKHVLMRDLLPNAGPSFATKALFLGRAVRQLVATILGKIEPLERDDYSNKRVTASGHLLGDLFRDVLLRVRGQWVRRLESEWSSGAWRSTTDPMRMVTAKNVKSLFEGAFLSERIRKSMKGSWGAEDEARDEVTEADNAANGALVQDLSRVSYLSTVAHLRRVNNPLDRSVKMVGPHELRASHWGALCPSDTPDGPNIGLVSHLASTARITMGGDDLWAAATKAITSSSKVAPFESASAKFAKMHKQCKVFLDDTWMGVTSDPLALATELRNLRRSNAFGPSSYEVSIAWRIVERELHVLTDRGRVLRPLAVVPKDPDTGLPTLPLPLWLGGDRDEPSTTTQKKQKTPKTPKTRGGADEDEDNDGSKDANDEPPSSLSVDVVDVEELRTRLVAMSPTDVALKAQTHRYTHCELVPARAMFSVLAGTIPMIEHNGAARCTLALAQVKQAVGIYSSAFRTRVDTTAYVLHNPQLPLVTTRAAHELWNGQHGNGENLIIAVCTYGGYNVEDALILNKGSVDRGRFALTCYDTLRFEETFSDDRTVSFGIPTDTKDNKETYRHLDGSGLPRPGAHVRVGEVLVGRVSKSIRASNGRNSKNDEDNGDKDVSIRANIKTCGVVDRVVSYTASRPWQRSRGGGASERAAKVRMRHTRRPELGDKLASRFSQKGVVGMILPEEDMPYSASTGLVPDAIYNPHSMPSRYTASHLMEILLAKAAAAAGIQRYDTTAFEGSDPIGEAQARLEALGMNRLGHEVIHNGITGEAMACDIYVGINYYGRLKHMVADKLQFRTANGPVNAITRQPTKALQGGSGGLRIGEMERDAIYSHGMASFLQESFTVRSDAKTGTEARVDVDADGRLSSFSVKKGAPLLDGGPSQQARIRLPHAFSLMQQELQAMSIDTRLHVDVRTDGDYNDVYDLRDEDDSPDLHDLDGAKAKDASDASDADADAEDADLDGDDESADLGDEDDEGREDADGDGMRED